jgi:uncharacterized protein YjbI with pentapeptide repeats
MKIQIKFRWSDRIIFEGEYESLKRALMDAVKKKTDLSGADLSGADLSGADLRDAVLSGAVLSGAVLRGADLRGAVLSGAVLSGAVLSGAVLSGAVLSGADLRDAVLRGADLRDAVLSGADLSGAVLRGAVLRGAVLRDADLRGVPKIEKIHQKVYAAASQPNALDMGKVHICETTHCRAGWVITLAGEGGAAMEFCMGWAGATALIYLKSDPTLERIPNFYAENEDALADMKRLADLEAGKAA